MGGKGSGRTAAAKRTESLRNFANAMESVNYQFKHTQSALMRVIAKGTVPGGCYASLYKTLRELLDDVYKLSLRLERHARDEIFQRENDNEA